MIVSVSLLLVGVVLAVIGGSLFVDGAVALARWARWPVAVIGVTVAAFGTSSPELMVAVQAAVDGVPQISLGNVLGSNVVNIALVLALVLSWSGMKAEDDGVRRDWACALAVPFVLAAVLALAGGSSVLSGTRGGIGRATQGKRSPSAMRRCPEPRRRLPPASPC
ncbi:MAG: hypothetical protein IPO58_21055 [Betaproteobacteria bacterium]|nr:hypothetical protein [Betaproteobacteria bacterium]